MSKKRILIVDPEPKSARLLEMSFRAAGYHGPGGAAPACPHTGVALAVFEKNVRAT